MHPIWNHSSQDSHATMHVPSSWRRQMQYTSGSVDGVRRCAPSCASSALRCCLSACSWAASTLLKPSSPMSMILGQGRTSSPSFTSSSEPNSDDSAVRSHVVIFASASAHLMYKSLDCRPSFRPDSSICWNITSENGWSTGPRCCRIPRARSASVGSVKHIGTTCSQIARRRLAISCCISTSNPAPSLTSWQRPWMVCTPSSRIPCCFVRRAPPAGRSFAAADGGTTKGRVALPDTLAVDEPGPGGVSDSTATAVRSATPTSVIVIPAAAVVSADLPSASVGATSISTAAAAAAAAALVASTVTTAVAAATVTTASGAFASDITVAASTAAAARCLKASAVSTR
mmetsp:Transcript_40907/g.94233  ORF Transcript_40907/g.94233 Transcript_40907/m.94233 type:complete len:344 (-) Transcript_40907:1064-2095(-)